MGKFIQYDLGGIFPILDEYISKLELNKKYNFSEAMDVYKKCKFSETKKTRQNFFGILKNIVFNGFNDKDLKYNISPLAQILINDRENEKLMKEVIHKYLYENIEIFRMECNILWDYLGRNGFLTKTKSNLEDFLSFKIEEALNKKEGYSQYIDNAKNKMERTIRNLTDLGIAREKKSEEVIYIDYYKPDWKLFAYLLVNELKKKKITLDKIKHSEFLKIFFISPDFIDDYILKMNSKSLLLLENRSGLSQIDLTYPDIEDLAKNIN